MNGMLRLTLGLSLWAVASWGHTQQAPTLTVGSTAPELRIHSWIKGKELTQSTKEYTVVEFWATWCEPCKRAIPDLTRIAQKFKSSTDIVGVSVREVPGGEDFGPVPGKVTDFVTKLGIRMDYPVALDGPDNFMSTKWLDAAGRKTIPTSFLLDKNRKILWIGYDTSELEYALTLLSQGIRSDDLIPKLDARRKKIADDKKQAEKLLASLSRNIPAEKRLSTLEEAFRLDPELAAREVTFKISLLLEAGKIKEAFALTKGDFYRDHKDDPNDLLTVAYTFIQRDKPTTEQVELAFEFAERSMSLRKEPDAFNFDCLARISYARKNVKKALEFQTKAVELAKKDKSMGTGNLMAMTDALKRYQLESGSKR